MKSIVALALAAVLSSGGLAACSGSAHSGSTMLPKSVQSAQKHVRHLKSQARKGQTYGGGPADGMALDVSLYDAPIAGITDPNAKFNAGILGVDAIDANGDSWQLTGSGTPQVVDLFSLQTAPLHLGSGTLPAGTYGSLQLLLDPASTTLTLNGQTYPVYFVTSDHPWWDPTQTVEAVTVPVSVTGANGDSLSATLDFNVFQSASLHDGAVYLTPTLAGGLGQPVIDGVVANAAGGPVSNATVVATDANGNVANTTVTHADGSFELHGINPGGYTVSVLNTSTTAAGETVTAVGADDGAAPSKYIVVGPNSKAQLGTLQD